MYLACGTRPDIAFVVGQLIRHNADPRRSHMQVAKRVAYYFHGIIEMGLIYRRKIEKRISRDLPPYGLSSFANSNFAGDFED